MVNQPDEDNGFIKRVQENHWDLRLSDSVPVDIEILTGASDSHLDLSNIDLIGLSIEMGAGNGTFDLSGIHPRDLSARIKGGVGNIIVYLPSALGVRVNVRSALTRVDMPGFTKDSDRFVNDVYGKTAETINLVIESAIGGVDVQLR